jgi:hypothetical protein
MTTIIMLQWATKQAYTQIDPGKFAPAQIRPMLSVGYPPQGEYSHQAKAGRSIPRGGNVNQLVVLWPVQRRIQMRTTNGASLCNRAEGKVACAATGVFDGNSLGA